MHNIIYSFDEILIDKNKKPLIICDIDYTLIRPIHNLTYYKMYVKKFHPNFYNPDQLALNMMDEDLSDGLIKLTDPEGFNKMMQNIENCHGSFVFLTSRHINSHRETLKHLQIAGFDYDVPIYYSNLNDGHLSKGEFIKQNIKDLFDKFNQVIFIDDNIEQINSVRLMCPTIKCYQFVIE